ncbi:SHD1 domain-containing protein [Rubripirellula lacrimiformis]|uniref:SHD1 domain-containing protein n=1 Tax=Rubripirellula lacrimiformis TaxID=1930273 RepID=UPI001FE59C8F|nr:SHD1 domain-containing protein [Rubripirellula lacrimiformis]
MDDAIDFRTWIDSTGKHSTVAKYLELKVPSVVLEKLDGDRVKLRIDRLSNYDKKYLQSTVDKINQL